MNSSCHKYCKLEVQAYTTKQKTKQPLGVTERNKQHIPDRCGGEGMWCQKGKREKASVERVRDEPMARIRQWYVMQKVQSRGRWRLSIKKNEARMSVLEGRKKYQQGGGHVCMCMCIYKCMRIMGRCRLDWVRMGWDGDGDDKNDQDAERNEL